MTDVNIRRQGGAAIMTIPVEVLRALKIGVGSTVVAEVTDGALVVRPVERTKRIRYSLREILKGATPEAARQLADSTAWAREGDPVGREIA